MNSTRYGKFFVGMFLLIAATAVFRWILLRNVAFSYMDGEFPWWIQQKDYVHTKENRLEVLFLGDSRMKAAVIPELVCDNAYNLALGGATSLEMYYSLQAYIRCHPNPEKIIIAFQASHYEHEPCFKSRTLYFHFLPFREALEAHLIAYKTGQLDLTHLREEVTDMLKYELLFPQKYSAACINSKFKREAYNRSQYQENVVHKGQMFFGRAERYENLNSEAYPSHFSANPRLDHYLRRIIHLCKEEGIPLYIEQLPINEPKLGQTPAGEDYKPMNYYDGLKNYLLSLAEETGISVETEIPCYAPEFFGDSAHLNPRGAERFTAEIKAKYGL